jgi:hypothetical protein
VQRDPEEGARGWQAYIVDDPRDDEPAYVVAYCVDCGAREFGPGTPPDSSDG